MKKVVRFFALAAIAFGMTTFAACGDDPEDEPQGEPILIDENFDAGTPSGWTLIDADGDGYGWSNMLDILGAGAGHNSSDGCMLSMSFVNGLGPLTPDNFMVTPSIKIASKGYNLTWYVAAQDAAYPEEHYAVVAGTLDNGNFVSQKTLFEETFSGNSKDQSQWFQRSVNLDEFKGQDICIAFRHYNCTDAFYLLIDDVKIALE